MTGRTWELAHDQRPLPMNAYRRLHHHERARYDASWREAFAWLARAARVPALEAITVTIRQECARPPLPDVGASFPTAKAAIDGLVDARVLVDDDTTRVLFLGFAVPVRGPRDRFVLVIEEATAPTHEGEP